MNLEHPQSSFPQDPSDDLHPDIISPPTGKTHLNHPDLSELKCALRATFNRTILSDFALNGIINWRKVNGEFTSLTQLAEIKGIGKSTLGDLASELTLGPEQKSSLKFIFGSHGILGTAESIKDGEANARILQAEFRTLPKGEPATVWFENAIPSTFSELIDDPTGYIKIITRLSALIRVDPTVIMADFERGLTEQQTRDIFLRVFNRAVQEDKSARHSRISRGATGDVDSFFSPIHRVINEESAHRKVTITLEPASFEAIAAMISSQILAAKALRLLTSGKVDQALDSELQHWEFSLKALDERDKTLMAEVKTASLNPLLGTHFIIRGSAHKPKTIELAKEWHCDLNVIDGPSHSCAAHPFVAYLMGTMDRSNLALVRESCLREIVAIGILPAPLTYSKEEDRIWNFVLSCTTSTLNDWIEKVGSVSCTNYWEKKKLSQSWFEAQSP